MKSSAKIIFSFALGVFLWLLPIPQGLEPKAWQLFAIFVGTISAIILRPFAMPATALMGLTVTILTKTLTFDQAFAGFSKDVIWLIVFAFFVAHGIIKTGLGARISYFFMILLGKKTLGLSYGLAATDLVLSPAIPSSTARAGGVLFPIIEALADSYDSKPKHPSRKKIGSYLINSTFQVNCVTNAMFVTAMSGNPLIVQMAAEEGIHLTWLGWAIAALVPGLVSLMAIPYIVYKIHPPEITETPMADKIASEKLKEMGKIQGKEWMMITVFLLLIALWIGGHVVGINATTTALIGVSILLLARVIHWEQLVKEEGAWSTLIWFAVLVTMAGGLNKLGFMSWFGDRVVDRVGFLPPTTAFISLLLIYFYSHYLFASNLAHIGAMFGPFLAVSLKLGAAPYLAAFSLAAVSSLYGSLTHYGSGPAAILYGPGYSTVKEWWGIGFVISLVNIAIWGVVGSAWWKILGYF